MPRIVTNGSQVRAVSASSSTSDGNSRRIDGTSPRSASWCHRHARYARIRLAQSRHTSAQTPQTRRCRWDPRNMKSALTSQISAQSISRRMWSAEACSPPKHQAMTDRLHTDVVATCAVFDASLHLGCHLCHVGHDVWFSFNRMTLRKRCCYVEIDGCPVVTVYNRGLMRTAESMLACLCPACGPSSPVTEPVKISGRGRHSDCL